MNSPTREQTERAPIDEVAFVRSRAPGVQIALVTGGREVQRALRGHVVHRLQDQATVAERDDRITLPVHEGIFIKVKYVVDDDVAASGTQVANVLREARHSVEGGSEIEFRRGR